MIFLFKSGLGAVRPIRTSRRSRPTPDPARKNAHANRRDRRFDQTVRMIWCILGTPDCSASAPQTKTRHMFANIGHNTFHWNRAVSWLISKPFWFRVSSALRCKSRRLPPISGTTQPSFTPYPQLSDSAAAPIWLC